MNPVIYILLFLVVIILLGQRRRKKGIFLRQVMKRKKAGGNNAMQELIRQFIGKRCLIQTFNAQADGVIKEVSGGGILLEKDNAVEVINLDFIVCVKEYPKNKKGKDKALVWD